MIPISLSLQNFLSYGENVPPLDFSGFHVACISGRNGHGKSALLDAITWALWGEARKSGSERRPNDGLLRIGATEMRVDFEFFLENDRYRISRSFRKTGKSATTRLEFQIYSPETNAYKTLSEESAVRQTQASIDTLLRMTYETFINSAFLLQGRADEFTRCKASQRKALLSDILGLSHYDDLSSLAREHAREEDIELATARAKKDDIAQTIEKRGDFVAQRDSVNAQLHACNSELESAENRREELRKIRTQRERHEAEREALQKEISRIESDMKEQQTVSEKAQQDIAAYREILGRRAEIANAAKKYRACQKEDADLQTKLHTLRPLEKRAGELDQKIADQRHEVERRLGEWQIRIGDAERALRETEALLSDRETIQAQLEALHKARQQDREWEEIRENRERVERNIRDLERQIDRAIENIKVEINTYTHHRQQTDALVAEIETRGETRQSLRTQAEENQSLEAEREEIRNRGSALKIQIENNSERLDSLCQDREDIAQQQQTLQNVQDASCPLCGSELDQAHREEVSAKLAKQLREQRTQITQLESDIQKAEAEREQHRHHYQKIKNLLAQREDITQRLAEAEAALKEAENAVQTRETLSAEIKTLETQLREQTQNSPDARALSEARSTLESLTYNPAEHRTLREKLKTLDSVEAKNAQLRLAAEQREKVLEELPTFREKRDLAQQWLNKAKYAPSEQAEREQVHQRIRSLGYNAEHHQHISRQLADLQDAPAQYERLQVAERDLENAQTQANTAKNRLAELTERDGQARQRLTEITEAINSAESTLEEANALENNIAQMRTQRDDLLQQNAALQSQIEHCDALGAEQNAVEEKIKSCEREIRIYRELTTAFGKDGIQALIIEQAIPEIEEEANRILTRLTDNRTQIALESLRDLKTGGTRETLDIKISDELGERSYELYSGGEAFRIDFSIRIALSKLLSRRTGTRLRTLVIDEGFGTQDAEGLDHLVEAIQAISGDFEKILIITHVESLKQAFPVRIEVNKYPDLGSRFEVLY
ncbi:MAG: SMC family ATPase [Gemmatimonadetes bacterium]|nr:SMC family ATPase [Gemmatimonadota bacterium]